MDVREIYQDLLKKGYSAKDAAKEAQSRTGTSLVTGQKIRAKQLTFTKEGITYGQYDTLHRGFNSAKFGQF